MLIESVAAPELRERRARAIDAFATLMADQAREFYGDGTISDDDLRLTAVALTGAVNEAVVAWLDGRLDVPAERLVEHCAGLFVAAAGRLLGAGPMIGALAALALAAATAGPAPANPVADLGDAQLAGQRIVTGFEGSRPPAVAAAPDRRRADRRRDPLRRQLRLARRRPPARRRARARSTGRAGLGPLLVMIDQEGGLVKRLPGPPSLSAAEMGAAGKRACRRQGAATARLARADRDQRRPRAGPRRRPRRLGDRVGGAVVRAPTVRGRELRRARSPRRSSETASRRPRSTSPGSGRRRPTPTTPSSTSASRRSAFDGSTRCRSPASPPPRSPLRLVMLSSAIYPALSGRPASMSRKVVRGELRRRLGLRRRRDHRRARDRVDGRRRRTDRGRQGGGEGGHRPAALHLARRRRTTPRRRCARSPPRTAPRSPPRWPASSPCAERWRTAARSR